MELKPRAGGWKVQTNPLSYAGTPRRQHSRFDRRSEYRLSCLANKQASLIFLTIKTYPKLTEHSPV